MIQKQKWPEYTRYIIAHEVPGGTASVMLKLFNEPQIWNGQCVTAYLYGLWVDEAIRRRGYASRLLYLAEQIAKEQGHESVFLEWSIMEAPHEICAWYERSGYVQKAFNTGETTRALMMKSLTEEIANSIKTPYKHIQSI